MELPSKEELMRFPAGRLVTFVVRLYANFKRRTVRLEAKIAELEAELRDSKRSKAPFTKGTRKEEPKKPGRKAGQGVFTHRPEPVATEADQVVEHEAPLGMNERLCPDCDTPLVISEETVTIEDVPPQPTRVIKRIRVEKGWCPKCGYRCRGKHPLLRAHQSGANAHQLGPNVLALALCQHFQHGLPLRKVPAVVAQTTGIKVTQSALSQAALTLCAENGVLGGHYEDLRGRIAKAPVVNTDDTGWRVNANPAYLMGFFSADVAYYQICARHRAREVLAVLTLAFCGLLGTDRFRSYESKLLDFVHMQKCLCHILKNISEVEKTKTGRAKTLCLDLMGHFREGIELWRAFTDGKISREEFDRRGKEFEDELYFLLRPRMLTDADNQRILDGLWYQLENERLTLFLHRPEIEPTNNKAERGLRPAVIARKVSQCSKNERGANAYAVMKSIVTTIAIKTKNVAGALAALICGETFETACER